jgi:hypothetical protein
VSTAADDRLVAVLLRSDAQRHRERADELDGTSMSSAAEAHRRCADYLSKLARGFASVADDEEARS